MNGPRADNTLVVRHGVDGSGLEPPVGAHRAFHGAGVEPLLEGEVASLIQVLREGLPRREPHEVPHEAEGGLDEGLEVGSVLATKTSLGQ